MKKGKIHEEYEAFLFRTLCCLHGVETHIIAYYDSLTQYCPHLFAIWRKNSTFVVLKHVAHEYDSPALSNGSGGLSRTNVKRKAGEQSTLFTVTTVEGIDMRFSVVSEEEKTCVVGGPVPDKENYYYYGVDLNTTGTVTIPKTANGYTVIGIDVIAFKNHVDITEVIIPEGVQSIGSNAFNGCTGLTSMTIPNSVNTIVKTAFST